MKWQAISSQAMHLRSWDDEYIVYNSLSGDTHLLGVAAGHILMQLQRAPSDEATLIESLCQAWQAEPNPELSLQIQDILADLQKFMLIEEAA